jgi:uncharacterized protein with FMN-binding domain
VRRITIAFLTTLSAVAALFSYHTSTNASSEAAGAGTSASAAAAGSGTSDDTGASSDTATGSSSSGSSSSGSSSSGSSSTKTYTGDTADTRWGIVQVEITVKSGKITKSEAVQYPSENGRDQEINAYAVPQLNSEVLAQQSGSIDAVSGATVTSDGYIQSLQSAIDKAHL